MWIGKKLSFNKYFQSIERGGTDTFTFWTLRRELQRREVIKTGFNVICLDGINTSFVHELKNSFSMPRGADGCAAHPVQLFN